MFPYKYKTFTIKKQDSAYRQLNISTGYSVTSNVRCKSLYEFSKQNNLSFNNLCIEAIYRALDDLPELKNMVEGGKNNGPLIQWDDYKEGKMRVTFTSRQTFINGNQLNSFFNRLDEYMKDPNLIMSDKC